MNTQSATASVRLRPARPADAAELAGLSDQLGYPSTPAEVERRLLRILPDPQHAVYVAEAADGHVVGWIHVFGHVTVEADARAEVGGLVVDQAHRGVSVGRLLMQQAEQWAREQGYASIGLRSNVIRKEAHAFYERLGYTCPKTQRMFRKAL